jgi:phosphoserine phosphatase
VLIARLIAEPDALSANLEQARADMDARGLRLAMAGMLDFCGETMQIGSPDEDAVAFREILDAHFSPSDGLIAEREPVVPHVFISDMDSTMITAECIDELADFAGLKDKISEITERAMQGELDFEQALRERVRLLEGLPETAIAECLAERIAPMPGARRLVATLKAQGCRTILVTGGFYQFANPVAKMLGFEKVVANTLDVVDGKIAGTVSGQIVDSGVKRATLIEECAAIGDHAISLATGDGANDIPMLEAATYGVAYHAKPKARAAANGWIDRGDLTGVLQLLGIPRSDWGEGG